MQTKLTNRPVEQSVAAIRALDLDPIRLRVTDAELGEGWSPAYADNIELAYRNYLTMLVKHPEDAEDIVVSKDVDEFWHAHILHTMKYTEDCEKVFGTYLHHNPHIGERTQADVQKKAALAEKTRRLYQQEFGGAQIREAAQPGKGSARAFCAAALKGRDAAFCAASVRVEDAAFCAAAIKTENAAFCAAAVKAQDAAFCAASVRAEDAAFCAAAIKTENAAFCAAALKTQDAAFCASTVKAKNAAFCAAAIKSREAAFCAASVKGERSALVAPRQRGNTAQVEGV